MTTTYTTNINGNGTAISAPVYGNGTPYYRLKGNNVDYIHKYNSADVRWTMTNTINVALTITGMYSDCGTYYASGRIRVYGSVYFSSTGSEGTYSTGEWSLVSSGRCYMYLNSYQDGHLKDSTQIFYSRDGTSSYFDFTTHFSDLDVGTRSSNIEYKLDIYVRDDVLQFRTRYYTTNPANNNATTSRYHITEWTGTNIYSLGTISNTGSLSKPLVFSNAGWDTGPYQEY